MYPQPPQPQKAPSGVTAVAVIAFIYGLFGFMCSAYGGINAGSAADQIRAQRLQMQNLPQNPFGNTAFYDELIANAEAMMVPTIIMELLSLGLAVAVVVVGFFAMTRKPGTLKLLPPVFIGCIVFTLIHVAYSSWAAIRQQEALEQMMSSMTGQGGGAMGSFMSGAMGAGIGIAICLGVGWALLKLAYFSWSLVYFRKPHVRAWFDPSLG